jgi:hypothetical protein
MSANRPENPVKDKAGAPRRLQGARLKLTWSIAYITPMLEQSVEVTEP